MNRTTESYPTVDLLQAIGYPTDEGFVHSSPTQVDLSEYATRNKIGDLYVWQTDDETDVKGTNDDSDGSPLDRLDALRRTVKQVSDLFIDEGLDFALVKTPIDFPADFSDVDVLVGQSQLTRARKILRSKGYEPVADSPSSTDFVHPKTGSVVDVQNDFTLRELVYLPGKAVLNNSEDRCQFERRIRTPTDPTQLALIVIHSLTEQLYTLRDFYHIVSLFERFSWGEYREFRQFVGDFGLAGAMNAALPLTARLSEEVFGRCPEPLRTAVKECRDYGEYERFVRRDYSAPHRYSARTMIRTVGHKFKDPVFRSSTIDELTELRDPRIVRSNIKQLLYRQRRESY